jgi:hypothetical protein
MPVRILPYIIKIAPKQEEEKKVVSELEKKKPKSNIRENKLFFIKV